MTDWAYLKHNETGGVTRVPDDPEVLSDFALRGWEPTDDVPADIYIPHPDGYGPRTDLDENLYKPAEPTEGAEDVEPNPDDAPDSEE